MRALTPALLADLQGTLMRGTPMAAVSGRLRNAQVVIGRRPEASGAQPIKAARFVPPPPGMALDASVRDLTEWMRADHSGLIDPVVATAMSHYQFESLHPFADGNGRLGRFLIVVQLLTSGVLSEPTLTVSPWFEARRGEYYDHLFAVSANGDWEGFVAFFAAGLRDSAIRTRVQMESLVSVQQRLHAKVRDSRLRAESNFSLVDLAIAHPSFTAQTVASELRISTARAHELVKKHVELGIIKAVGDAAYGRRFYAPHVLEVLITG